VNPRIKELMKELADAISGSMSESEQIAHVIGKINDEGFDIFLMLEATVGVSRLAESAHASRELVGMRNKNSDDAFTINAQDVRFLKSLRIRVDDAP
jgi:hypothetical protein